MQARRESRTSATRCSTACAWTRRVSPRSRAPCARSPRSPDPVGRGDRRPAPAQRAGRAQGARAARRVAVVYEARPNVTIDAAALCLKSGNAIVLRGSSSAAHSNAVLAQMAAEAAAPPGCRRLRQRSWPAAGARSSPSSPPRSDAVDLIIPRGGEGLKAALQGGGHRPRDLRRLRQLPRVRRRPADLDAAQAIVSTPRPSAPASCNAAETLLVHGASPLTSSARAARAAAAGVKVRADERTRAHRDGGDPRSTRHRRGLGQRVPRA